MSGLDEDGYCTSKDCRACRGWRPINVSRKHKTVCFRIDLLAAIALISYVIARLL